MARVKNVSKTQEENNVKWTNSKNGISAKVENTKDGSKLTLVGGEFYFDVEYKANDIARQFMKQTAEL